MKPARIVKASCMESDKRNKMMAAEYKISAKLLRRRIIELETKLHTANIGDLERASVTERLKILNSMLRTTTEIGCEAEHYYEMGWWRSGIYTLNSRKRG